ncbi:AfsR/SARP family transcriptional regulator [Pseudonocardia asaccharolytica]|uniref:Bacterial transcriptional activator domain-containing protein n=1 Tax=Pseudonocardia asaccharolytica DSM 44247 = NBRC 16224 TaxID=1123024 RepID=A0A511CZI6_9PSEU|nr:BTAD domain-containing putative transcriptional regulator [Pseudonocardia asaccharolytica]GEL17962.1 hypothetical protein PA7_17990 [Pseudonocardia asaccharolytica DSM 44247 = NBRC 16224]
MRDRAADAPARAALELLDAAELLWRGPAYAEFAERDFTRAETVRLNELRLATVEDRAGLLMTALYRAGRVGEVLDRYQDYRRLLADEIGLDLSPSLNELQVRILNHDLPAPRASGPPPPPRWSVSEAAFLGRDDDAAELVAAPLCDRPVATDLAELVDASLVVSRDGPGGARHRLLEIVRAFAPERLAETDVETDVRRAALTWALRTGHIELAGQITGGLALAAMPGTLRPELAGLVRKMAEHPGVGETPARSPRSSRATWTRPRRWQPSRGTGSGRSTNVSSR